MPTKEIFDMLCKVLDELINDAEYEEIALDNVGYSTDDADAKVIFFTALKHKAIKEERRCKEGICFSCIAFSFSQLYL